MDSSKCKRKGSCHAWTLCGNLLVLRLCMPQLPLFLIFLPSSVEDHPSPSSHLFTCLARAWPGPMHVAFHMPAYKYMPNSHEMERAGRGICRAGEVKGTRDKILHYLYMYPSSCLVAYVILGVDRSYGLRCKRIAPNAAPHKNPSFPLFSWGREVKALYTPRTAFTKMLQTMKINAVFSPV